VTYPDPEPGLVISYSFLWSDEAAEGHAEGRKHRPCAIVIAMTPDAHVPDGKRVVVLPITHGRPMDADAAVELPRGVKRHLGLDDAPSWVVLDEVNVFMWPGFDLRHVPGKPGQYAYGYLPPRFLGHLREKLWERYARGRLRAISRE
jgi:hypothetical protein